MKVLVGCFLLMSIGVVRGEAGSGPYPPSGWKPEGPTLEYGPPSPPQTPDNQTPDASQNGEETVDQVNNATMERLRQEAGAQAGEYYVYLPDGRLQKVQFTTAPLRTQEGVEYNQAQSFQAGRYAEGGRMAPHTQPRGTFVKSEKQGQSRPSRFQAQANGRFTAGQESRTNFNTQPFPQQQQTSQKVEENKDVKGYVASVQYTNVEPLVAPIYAYNPAPLVRILRDVPMEY